MGLLCIACEVHDAVDITVKHKAAVYLKYHYDNGKINTLNDIRTMRLFIFDEEGRLYRDTLLDMADNLQINRIAVPQHKIFK